MSGAGEAPAAEAGSVPRRTRRRWWPWLAGANVLFLAGAIASAVLIQVSTGFGWLGLVLTFPQFAFFFGGWPATLWGVINVVAVATVTVVAARRGRDRRDRRHRATVAGTRATFVMFAVNALPGVALCAYSLVQMATPGP